MKFVDIVYRMFFILDRCKKFNLMRGRKLEIEDRVYNYRYKIDLYGGYGGGGCMFIICINILI